eukprot:5442337-Amphidinium_carterae.1
MPSARKVEHPACVVARWHAIVTALVLSTSHYRCNEALEFGLFHIALLANSTSPVTSDKEKHMIAHTDSLTGLRWHLGQAVLRHRGRALLICTVGALNVCTACHQ